MTDNNTTDRVATVEVDLREPDSRTNAAGQEQQGKQGVKLSMDREQIEAKENRLELDEEEVQLIREILFSKINQGEFDKRELERFNKHDHSIRRYVRLGQDRTSTLYRTAACVKACMEWRKSLELYNLSDEDFSDEVLNQTNIIYLHGKTLEGENILWIRVADHRRQHNTDEFRKYMAYQLERIDRESDKCGFIVCIDCSNAGTSCIDLDLVTYFIKIVLFFRGNLRYVLIHDMGWLLGATWRLVKSWLPQEQRDGVKMASKKQLAEYVASDQLAEYAHTQ